MTDVTDNNTDNEVLDNDDETVGASPEERDLLDMVRGVASGDAEAKRDGLLALGVLATVLAFGAAFYHLVIKSAVKAALRETGVARK